VVEALHTGYRVPEQPLRLSDQEILARAGRSGPHPHPRTYFDVSPYVLFAKDGRPHQASDVRCRGDHLAGTQSAHLVGETEAPRG
jgi:hypothetical protein